MKINFSSEKVWLWSLRRNFQR